MLHIILPYYNYYNSKYRIDNLLRFVNKYNKLNNAKIYIVEGVEIGSDVELPDLSSMCYKHIKYKVPQKLWIKENLINLCIKHHLPHDWEQFAWIDADILFLNENWCDEAILKLKEYDVVQLFSSADLLDENFKLYKKTFGPILPEIYSGYINAVINYNRLKIENFYHKLHVGFGWAMTKQFYNKIGNLWEFNISGGADTVIAYSITRRLEKSDIHIGAINLIYSQKYENDLNDYYNKFKNCKFSYLEGSILHYWHGDYKSRKYVDRHLILNKYGFDSTLLNYTEQGILYIKNLDLENAMEEYLHQRETIVINKKAKLIVKPKNGLANRIIAVMSAMAFAKLTNRDFYICWTPSNGWSKDSLSDFFENEFNYISLEEFNNISKNSLNLFNDIAINDISFKELLSNNVDITYDGNARIVYPIDLKKYPFHLLEYTKLYFENIRSLKLKQFILDKVNEICKNFNENTIGIHIRRGDALSGPHSKKYKISDDYQFEFIIRDELKDNVNFFLSTDCEKTSEKFIKLFGDKIIVNKNKIFVESDYNKPKYNQLDAVIDLFCLSKTHKMYGTNWSTFSELAAEIGNIFIINPNKNKISFFTGKISNCELDENKNHFIWVAPEYELIVKSCKTVRFQFNKHNNMYCADEVIVKINNNIYKTQKLKNIDVVEINFEEIDINYLSFEFNKSFVPKLINGGDDTRNLSTTLDKIEYIDKFNKVINYDLTELDIN